MSHSSRDAIILAPLREALRTKTSDTLQLFLSSDGQSIPFGRNWVSTVETALNASTLMFSFVSPQSIGSAWLHFEAGFAYAKGARVVPVAVMGTDMNHLHPPLSLLQGFNCHNRDGLNNILAIINGHFSTSYPLTFTDDEYRAIFAKGGAEMDAGVEIFGRLVDRVETGFMMTEPEWVQSVESLKSLTTQVMEWSGRVSSHGIDITRARLADGYRVGIVIAPELFLYYAPFLRGLFQSDDALGSGTLVLRMAGSTGATTEMWKVTTRLKNSEVSLQHNKLHYKGTSFTIESFESRNSGIQTHMKVSANVLLAAQDLIDLVSLLNEKEILRIHDWELQ